jgi:hypothetical protein
MCHVGRNEPARPRRLRAGALQAGNAGVMALASSGPTQSIAVTLAALLAIVFLWASTLTGPIGTALGDIVDTLGLMAAIFYLLTAGTAVWYYRRVITRSASSFVLGGVLPGLGAAFMAFVIIYSLATGSLNGVEIGFGFGLALAGLVLSLVAQRTGHSPFWTDPATSHGDLAADELAGPEPA